jgi:hypothetical protein
MAIVFQLECMFLYVNLLDLMIELQYHTNNEKLLELTLFFY